MIKEMKDLGVGPGIRLARSPWPRGSDARTPGSQHRGRASGYFPYADFFRSVGNARTCAIFTLRSTAVHPLSLASPCRVSCSVTHLDADGARKSQAGTRKWHATFAGRRCFIGRESRRDRCPHLSSRAQLDLLMGMENQRSFAPPGR